jgi:hypothetical protein
MRKFLGIQPFLKQTQCSAISQNNYFKNYAKVSLHLKNFSNKNKKKGKLNKNKIT